MFHPGLFHEHLHSSFAHTHRSGAALGELLLPTPAMGSLRSERKGEDGPSWASVLHIVWVSSASQLESPPPKQVQLQDQIFQVSFFLNLASCVPL